MNRFSPRQRLVAGGVVLVLVLVAVGLWAMQRRREDDAATPAWTDPQQPGEGVANEVTALTADQGWAANRCRPFTASCGSNTAGRRVRREYPSSLTSDPGSFIRATLNLEGEI